MGKKRGNGEGCIRQTKDGYWEARIMIGRDENGNPKIKTFSGKKRSIVQERLNDFIANRRKVEPQNACNMTVEEWLKQWLVDYVEKNVKTSTRVSYEGYVKHHLVPNIGKIKIGNLKKLDLERMYEKLLKNGRADKKGGLSVKTVENVAACIHKALQTALEMEYIVRNIADIAKVPKLPDIKNNKQEVKILTKEEQKMLEAICDNSPYCMGVFVLLRTGMRQGEMLGLRWCDVDFENKRIKICRQVSRLHDYSENAKAKTKLGFVEYTKTKSSCRTITMSEVLVKRLLEYKRAQDENVEKWGKAYNNMGLVFAREDGYFIDPATFRDKYLKLLKTAGLEHYKVHALRHTFASRALEAGVAIKVVSKMLGHAGVQITMDIYQHVLPDMQAEAMKQIDDYISA